MTSLGLGQLVTFALLVACIAPVLGGPVKPEEGSVHTHGTCSCVLLHGSLLIVRFAVGELLEYVDSSVPCKSRADCYGLPGSPAHIVLPSAPCCSYQTCVA